MENFRYLIPVLLVGYLIYRRVQRTIGLQKYTSSRLIFRIVLFSLVAAMILAVNALQPMALISDGVGIILGVTLVYFAAKNTIFENRADGLYYRTHIWVELTVLCLFFSRLIYRFYTMSQVMQNADERMQNRMDDLRNPLTSGVFFIICAYYVGYFLFILKHAKHQLVKNID
jgi:hypothetical protein